MNTQSVDFRRTVADVALAVLFSVVAVVLVRENVVAAPDPSLTHQVESRTWWLLPVYLLAVAPILVRRTHPVAAVYASAAVFAVSVPLFGWAVRCGLGLPLAAAFAYAIARYAHSAVGQVVGVIGVVGLLVAALVRDNATGGLGALSFGIPLAAIFYGLGWFVRFMSGRRQAAGQSSQVDVLV